MPASELPANAFGQQHRKRPPPPIAWLRERFEYDPETGIIWHRKRDLFGTRKRADAEIDKAGYRRTRHSYQNERHAPQAHRLAFALITGRWPTMIDHIDRNRTNNRWSNLRETTAAQNSRNRAACHIWMKPDATMRQGFKWRVSIAKDNAARTTSRRDFCAAWKVRQAWLAERGQPSRAFADQ